MIDDELIGGELIDDELDSNDSPDEWQELADKCSRILTENNFTHTVLEEGLLDEIDPKSRELFHEYSQLLPVYSFAFAGKPERQLSICVAKLPIKRSQYGMPAIEAYAPYFNEVQNTMLLDISDARLFAAIRLADDPGYVFIEPHDIGSKLSEVFEQTELLVEGFAEFSKKFEFGCEDPDLAASVLTPAFFSLVAALEEPFLEIKDELLVVGYKTPCTDGQVVALAEFIQGFAEE